MLNAYIKGDRRGFFLQTNKNQTHLTTLSRPISIWSTLNHARPPHFLWDDAVCVIFYLHTDSGMPVGRHPFPCPSAFILQHNAMQIELGLALIVMLFTWKPLPIRLNEMGRGEAGKNVVALFEMFVIARFWRYKYEANNDEFRKRYLNTLNGLWWQSLEKYCCKYPIFDNKS